METKKYEDFKERRIKEITKQIKELESDRNDIRLFNYEPSIKQDILIDQKRHHIINAISNRMIELMKTKEMDINTLENAAGLVLKNHVWEIYTKRREATLFDLYFITSALDITIYDFFNDDRFKNLP